MRPATDLCDMCQKYLLRLQRVANRPEEEKQAELVIQKVHLEKANGQRGFHKEKVNYLIEGSLYGM